MGRPGGSGLSQISRFDYRNFFRAASTCSGRKPIPTIRAVIRRSSGNSSSSRAGRGGDICSVALKMRSSKCSMHKNLRTLCEVRGPLAAVLNRAQII